MSESNDDATQGAPQGDTAQQPETQTAPQPGTEQPSQTDGQKADEPKPPPDPRDRAIRRYAYDLREERRARQELEQRIRALEPQQDPNAPPNQADIDRRVNERAEALVEQRQQSERSDAMITAGSAEYGAKTFTEACNAMADMGAGENPAFMRAIARVPNGHRVLATLAAEPAEAARILALPPLDIALELAGLAQKAATPPPAPKATSQAPPPIKPIQPGARVEKDPGEMSEKEYMAWWNKRTVRRG